MADAAWTIGTLLAVCGRGGVIGPKKTVLEFPSGTVSLEELQKKTRPTYSICTCVNDYYEYKSMIDSFKSSGFTEFDCEYIYANNILQNYADAFESCNMFLRHARGKYIIICHQDILLIDDRAHLDKILNELCLADENWGIVGNAGGVRPGILAIRISDPHGEDTRIGGPYPVSVKALDENFLIVRQDANISTSGDLKGFHHYGTDLCIISDILGYKSYVVDFHIRHKSAGKRDSNFMKIRNKMISKYERAFRNRIIVSTCTDFVLTPHSYLNSIVNLKYIKRMLYMAMSLRHRS